MYFSLPSLFGASFIAVARFFLRQLAAIAPCTLKQYVTKEVVVVAVVVV